jgi:hypothetical protein
MPNVCTTNNTLTHLYAVCEKIDELTYWHIHNKQQTTNIKKMIFRIFLGCYLIYHFVPCIPYAEETFGNNMPYDYTISPLYGKFPNILEYINATWFIIIQTFLAGVFVYGYHANICALLLWYGWTCLFNRNPLISNPGYPYIGWSLLAMTFVELDNNRVLFKTTNSFLKKIQHDKLPKRIFWYAWFLMAFGYTASGCHKLVTSPSWRDGTALMHVLNSPLARDNFIRNTLVQYPTFLKWNTWLSLFLEIGFLPLGIFYHTRLPFWIIYICFHLGILATINFTDLTLGVLMIHLMTFDWSWTEKFNKFMYEKIQKRNVKYNIIEKNE